MLLVRDSFTVRWPVGEEGMGGGGGGGECVCCKPRNKALVWLTQKKCDDYNYRSCCSLLELTLMMLTGWCNAF